MNKKIKFLPLIILVSIFIAIISIFILRKYQIYKTNQNLNEIIIVASNKSLQGNNVGANSISAQMKANRANITNTENIVIDEADSIGRLTIPDISLKNAPIKEGTELTVLSDAIGHFNSTSIYSGNVGLASHNSGGKGDYFKNLKNIKIGSEIFYETEYGTKKYIVETKTIIDETDFSYLQRTEDNRITLITCVSGKKTKRLCVQAIEK